MPASPTASPSTASACRAARSSTSPPTSGGATAAWCGPCSTSTTGGPRPAASCSRSSAGSRTSTGSSGTATASTWRPRSPSRPARPRRSTPPASTVRPAAAGRPRLVPRAVEAERPRARRHHRARPRLDLRPGWPAPTPASARRGSRSSSPRSPAGRWAGSAPRPSPTRPSSSSSPAVAPDTEVAGQLLVGAIAVGQRLADELGRPVDLLATDQPGTPVEPGGARRRPTRTPSPAATTPGWPTRSAFLRAIEPVLSRRLASSGLVADRGELSISLYERGVLLAWEGGRVTRIEAADPDPEPFESRRRRRGARLVPGPRARPVGRERPRRAHRRHRCSATTPR